MRRRRLIWRIYPAYLVVVVVCTTIVAYAAGQAVRRQFARQAREDLRARLVVLEKAIEEQITTRDPLGRWEGVPELVHVLSRAGQARVTLVDTRGAVLVDSARRLTPGERAPDWPEVDQALGGRETSISAATERGEQRLALALPIEHEQRVLGAVRLEAPVQDPGPEVAGLYLEISLFGLLSAVLAAVLGWMIFASQVTRPLRRIKLGAQRFAGGQLQHKLPILETDEIGGLAEALNQMAHQLDDKIRTITQQAYDQRAVLSSMTEGVIAVDTDERVISLNEAAARLLQTNTARAVGRSIQEAVRNTDLQAFVARTLTSAESVVGDLHFREGGRERVLQANGAVLQDPQGRALGALVVLNDITRLRRLETMRRDFVANVSHELKTPITAIKGFVETLCDGAMEDARVAKRFLEILTKQADRLDAIIDDLLHLSRIEQEEESEGIQTEQVLLRQVLGAAVLDTQVKAQARGITVNVTCPTDLAVQANPQLLEQALVNLLDNAIKYSDQGARVDLEARQSEGAVCISVRDQGCGIAPEHLEHLFERFYRVDKARSRELGGTGLGLAIVKHIAQAHRGRVEVRSRIGQGSDFTVHLPAA